MKVLFATTEFAGLAKAGGLGDVSADLPRALRRRGVDVRVLLPGYPSVLAKAPKLAPIARLPGRGRIPACDVGKLRLADGTTIYVLIEASLYGRPGSPYCDPQGVAWPDNDIRFARLSLAAAQLAQGRGGLSWVPDLLHVHDWPGSLAPAYLRWRGAHVPTLLTIHNVAYQGLYGRDRLADLAVPEAAFAMNGVEFYGQVSFLKAGLYYADHVNTVSPTYAREITTEALGCGLHGLTQELAAKGRLSGIINGIDDSWDPGRDPHLPHHFEPDDLSGKRAIADGIRVGLCLAPSDGPLFGIVSRLVHQKGLDIVADAAREIVREGGQLAILGMGDPATENMLSRLARSHRDHIGLLIGFNEPMARRVVAGSDFCLMPSRFEPCGLVQMQAQRYGSLPIAHATGGLADTIDDGTTGFLFSELSSDGLYGACKRAFGVFSNSETLGTMRRMAMTRAFHWSSAAEEYEKIYSRLTGLVPAVKPARSTRRRSTVANDEARVAA